MDIQRINLHTSAFNEITHYIESDNGKEQVEVWFARELQSVLGYARWENFTIAIGRAVESCKSQNINVDDHFREVTKMISLAKGAKREVKDYMLTRFACYLIAQNGDPKKEEIAFAQGYFALQTRRAELIAEHLQQVSRLETRDRLRASEKQLSRNIYERGVDDRGSFKRRHGFVWRTYHRRHETSPRHQVNTPVGRFSSYADHCCKEPRNRNDKLQCGAERPLWRTEHYCRTHSEQCKCKADAGATRHKARKPSSC